jgi:TM2 domain
MSGHGAVAQALSMSNHTVAITSRSSPVPAPSFKAPKSKAVAAWLAIGLGTLGVHRHYLHGWRDVWAWLYLLPTALGAAGVMRLRNLGQDDHWGTLLAPLLGAMVTVAMGFAIAYALTPDEKWAARYNPGTAPTATAWLPVLAAALALLLGGTAMMATITYSIQQFFEWQMAGR